MLDPGYPPPSNDLIFWGRLAILVAFLLTVALDLLLLFRYGREATLSYVIAEAATRFPILPYLLAFGFGAFFYHILTINR